MSDVRTIRDVLREKQVPVEPEPLDGYADVPLVLRSYELAEGEYGTYARMNCVDEQGEAHLLTTGGVGIVRILSQMNPEDDFPVRVTFTKVKGERGKEVWGIQ